MRFDRLAAKTAAKERIREVLPGCLLVTLVYLLLTDILTSVVTALTGNLSAEAVGYLTQGYQLDEVIEYVFFQNSLRTALHAIGQVLLDLFGVVMSFGFTAYTLALARRQEAGMDRLFDGFNRLGRVLWMNILVYVFTSLWCLLGAVPGIVLLVVGAGMMSYELIMFSTFAMAAGMVLGIVASYRYRMAPFLLIDHRDCTARQSIRRSKELMKGRKGELFFLDLSFFGWLFLGAGLQLLLEELGVAIAGLAVASLVYLWVLPYMNVTVGLYYDFVAGENMADQPL